MKTVGCYDIAVIGGGVAGAAAALQAARCGKRTVLVEKAVLLGGLATSGLIYYYMPLCDGRGRQVTFGIAEELLRRSLLYGPGEIPDGWADGRNRVNDKRLCVRFAPAAFMLALGEALEEAGVELWLDTLFCGVNRSDDGRITAVEVENKSGRLRIEAKFFIDATGDADVARRAGAHCLTDDNCLSAMVLEYDEKRGCREPFLHAPLGQFGANRTRRFTPIPGRADMLHDVEIPRGEDGKELYYRGISGRAVSDFILKSHKLLRDHYREAYAQGAATRDTLYPVKLPLMPLFRKIHAIDGARTMRKGEFNREAPDSVGMIAGISGPGVVWEVPFGAMYPKERIGSLLVAGRSISAAGDAWDAARLIPAVALTGQVSAVAASMMVDRGCEPWELEVAELQKALGFPLHLSDLR
ncbi:MAG: FAD-dependent oxidoreductase [Lentisphaeria bacterium]|nr:FAD-dependent oxidoreductase [Lentisphaeria bacterium]